MGGIVGSRKIKDVEAMKEKLMEMDSGMLEVIDWMQSKT